MELYLSLDGYSHIPRNLLGFKKNTAVREARPVVSAIINNYGAILHKGNFRSAKTQDDPAWNQKVVNPADYGHRSRDTDIFHDLCLTCDQVTVDRILVFDKDVKVIDNLSQRMYGCTFADYNISALPFYQVLDEHLEQLPDEYLSSLSNIGKFNLTINLEEEEKYDKAQRSILFHSHIACPAMQENDGAIVRANKMFTTMRLAQRLQEDFERWHD